MINQAICIDRQLNHLYLQCIAALKVYISEVPKLLAETSSETRILHL